MPTETSERKPTKSAQIGAAPPPEPEHLPCPRCDSTNTKFCYYNNYNFSQPRHFCKSCRRYWTHGGTLRDIPVGGGSRKNAKRSRTTAAAAAAGGGGGGSGTVFSPAHYDFRHMGSQVRVPFAADHSGYMGGSFTSLLNSNQGSSGLLALGGFGLGIEDVGFGLGRAVWPFPAMVEGGAAVGSGGGPSVGGNTWQLENGDGGFVGSGDCFALPDLAISTPGSVLK